MFRRQLSRRGFRRTSNVESFSEWVGRGEREGGREGGKRLDDGWMRVSCVFFPSFFFRVLLLSCTIRITSRVNFWGDEMRCQNLLS